MEIWAYVEFLKVRNIPFNTKEKHKVWSKYSIKIPLLFVNEFLLQYLTMTV